jgi:hypothetical protein
MKEKVCCGSKKNVLEWVSTKLLPRLGLREIATAFEEVWLGGSLAANQLDASRGMSYPNIGDNGSQQAVARLAPSIFLSSRFRKLLAQVNLAPSFGNLVKRLDKS